MRRIAPSTASLSLLAVALGLAGCSAGSGPSTTTALGPGTLPDSVLRAPASRAEFGVVLPRGFVPPAQRRAAGPGWLSPYAKAGKNVVYIADQGAGAVRIYKQKGTGQQPIGEITQGISGVDGLFVDSNKSLYACNFGNGTVTVYPAGSTSPSETLSGAGSPIDVVVALDGTVFVANFNSGTDGTVLEYPKGQTTPSHTVVTFGAGSFPEGLGIDSQNALYVAYNTNDGEVLKFTTPSGSGTNLGIHVGYVGGMAIDKKNDILLVDQNLPGVDVFPPGSTSPSQKITGFSLAFDVAINKKSSEIFVTTPFNTPEASRLAYPAGTINDEITGQLTSAFGVATSPDGTD